LQTIDTKVDTRRLLTFEEIQQWAEDREFKGYLIYDDDREEWKINDAFFTRYMDNHEYVLWNEVLERGHYDFSDKTDSFWVHRYNLFELARQREIELTQMKWQSEDSLYEAGQLSEAEWQRLVNSRNPVTDEDWKIVKEFQKTFKKDSVLIEIHKERQGSLY